MLATLPVLTLKIFGMRRGPEVWGYGNASGFFASIIAIILEATFKQVYGFDGMFTIALFFIAFAATLSTFIEENKSFRYSDIYEDKVESTKNFN